MLQRIWLVQPLAFARGGGSPTPCDAFDWAEADLRPHGTGRTQIVPADTLIVDPDDGTVSQKAASVEIVFKDERGIRPVCPFFELHGCWEQDGSPAKGPVTPAILARSGKSATDLEWRIEFCNFKAAHWSQSPGDRVSATVELRGNDHVPQPLLGRSPVGAKRPLVPKGRNVPLGFVQLTCPNDDFPEFRLRFTPGRGLVYAPTNLKQRLAKLPEPTDAPDMIPMINELLERNAQWRSFSLPDEQCFLNPRAAWPNYALLDVKKEVAPHLIQLLPELGRALTLKQDQSELLRRIGGPGKDVRNLPPGLYANVTKPPKVMASLGMIDDYGDGLITCTLKGVGVAHARIVSGPPNFAPDRRPPVSLADGLADRVLRDQVRAQDWISDDNLAEADHEVQDMLDRAFETMGLANLDALNDYFATENFNRALRPGTPYTPEQAKNMVWSGDKLVSLDPLPLTSRARDRHRRNTAAAFFISLVLDNPDFMAKWIRVPAGPERMYDMRMPGLMRGADRMPLHLTRRQYDMLKAWVDARRARAEPGT